VTTTSPIGVFTPIAEPWYLPTGDEVALFTRCHEAQLPVLIKGPTGCGKTRFVQHMAWRLGRPIVTVACHDDLTAGDLTGRWLLRGDETVWVDGPLALAARLGALCYLDEFVEARQDTIVVLHPLSDDRRVLPIEKTGELLHAAPGFQLVVSYNPGYQHAVKDPKPSTRQRFVAIELSHPAAAAEAEIVAHEGAVSASIARSLVTIAAGVRRLKDEGLTEGPGTRVVVSAARLISRGIAPRDACRATFALPLTEDVDLLAAIDDLVDAAL
jgi:nitric oxide reductase NorQ protein